MLDCKKSLDFQKYFIQIIEDILLAHIRYMKKEIEREIKLIFLHLKKYLSESNNKEDFKEKSTQLLEKIKNLKEKLSKLQEEENRMIIEIKTRVTKTFECFLSSKENSFSKFKEYNEYQNNVLLSEYFLDKNLIETFFIFEKENNITIYEYNIYAEKKLLIEYIKENNTKKIFEWVKFYKKKIAQNNTSIIINLLTSLFYIYKNEHQKDTDCNINCINFIRKYFNDFTSTNKEDITKLIMSLIIEKNISEASKNFMEQIKDVVYTKYKQIFSLGSFSLFELLLTFGIMTLKTNVCGKGGNILSMNKNIDCPICINEDLSKMPGKIFNYIQNRSHLFCSITGKVTTESNPPMINKEGKIVCRSCVNKYKVNEEEYEDPKTKIKYKVSDCKLLYLS